jgi:subtilase family serine protease
MPASELDSFNIEAMKCAAIGVTILVASGDNGAMNYGCSCNTDYSVGMDNCACNASSASDESQWTGDSTWTGNGYFPSWPATSPYVTAVGATMGVSNVVPSTGEGEQVCMVCRPAVFQYTDNVSC